jgi:hypothetical protein
MFSTRFAVLTLLIATVATSGVAQRSNTLIKQRCHFYGESPAGSQAFHKDEICTIPGLKLLDQNYRQQDFVCCGGGATAPTTNEAIPTGLELRVKGGIFGPFQILSSPATHSLCTRIVGLLRWEGRVVM